MLVKELIKTKHLIFYGGGTRTQRAFIEYEIDRSMVEFIIDNSSEIQKSGFRPWLSEGDTVIPVYGKEYLESSSIIRENYIIIIAVTEKKSIIDEISKLGYQWYDLLFLETERRYERWKSYAVWMYYLESIYKKSSLNMENILCNVLNGNNFILPRATVCMTTRCTLKCKNCINMIPYYDVWQDVPYETVIKDIQSLLNVVSEWIFCELIGGEPFLYPDLDKILEFVINQNKIRNVFIITNATIIPKEKIMKMLQNDKIVVRVSNYGNEKKLNAFLSKMSQENVKVDVFYGLKWIVPGDGIKRGKSTQELKNQYAMCDAGILCKTLYRGRLYSCDRSMALHDLKLLDSNFDFMEMSDITTQKMINFYNRMWCIACDYCDMYSENMQYCVAGEQIQKDFRLGYNT